MRTYLILSSVLIFATFTSTSDASLESVINGGQVSGSIPGNNDFAGQLQGLYGNGATVHSGELVFDGWYRLDFFYHGAESGFTNSFEIDGVTVFTENNEAWDSAGMRLGSIHVRPGDILGASGDNRLAFTTSGNGVDAVLGDPGFGIFRHEDGSFIASNGRIFFGFDDLKGTNGSDDDFDDLVISAQLTAVPEPAAIAGWMMLIGILGYGLRRRLAA